MAMAAKPLSPVAALRVGLAGLGTVGGGVMSVLLRNAEEIGRRAGRPIQIVAVADLDSAKRKEAQSSGVATFENALEMLEKSKLDVLIELIGGYGFAKELVLAAVDRGLNVVTANKALLAVHGNEIFAKAEAKGATVAFEAAVAGGIPIIKALREGLVANQILSVAGIINGTTNFILSEMREKGLSFAQVLAEAQRLGYAEADPTFDVEGVDAAHKITLLCAMAFGMSVRFEQAHIEGISRLDSQDIAYADRLGYRIKLLGITRRRPNGVELRVHPTLIPAKRLIANVEGAMNAVVVRGDAVGETLYYGKGAGAEPTASAVIADLVDLARSADVPASSRVPHLGFQPNHREELQVLPIDSIESGYYLRLRVSDESGVLADITRVLADSKISIDAFFQREADDGQNQTDVILLTHSCKESQILAAMKTISSLKTVLAAPVMLRVESFE